MANKPIILLIYTGGTIGMVKDYASQALKAFNFDNILENIPELRQLNCDIDTISFDEPIDSSNMNITYYYKIADILEENYTLFDGFVVLTGSDTMAYTASAISFMLENLNKPVIFTGSQLPIGDLRTDAKENLITSIEVASSRKNGKPMVREIGLYFEYKLYRANRTTKMNAEQFEAFSSPNYPALATSGVHLTFNEQRLLQAREQGDHLKVGKHLDPNIALLKIYPGITEQFVQGVLETDGLKGVVLETYGSGNAPTYPWFIEALKKAISKGIYIINITQCYGGSVLMGHYETSIQLQKIGLIDGKDMTTESALAKLMYLLGTDIGRNDFSRYFSRSLRGEISEK